jgi:hypothetical protein
LAVIGHRTHLDAKATLLVRIPNISGAHQIDAQTEDDAVHGANDGFHASLHARQASLELIDVLLETKGNSCRIRLGRLIVLLCRMSRRGGTT